MKKHITKIQTGHAKKLQLATMVIFGLCSTMLGYASECPNAITIDAASPVCASSVAASVVCYGDPEDGNDTISMSPGGSIAGGGVYNENDTICNEYDYSGTVTSLVKGVNTVTASSSELGVNSDASPIYVTSNGGSGAGFDVVVSQGCPIPGYSCRAIITFNFHCLIAGHNYKWHEDITAGACTGGSCAGGQDGLWQQGSGTDYSLTDSAQGPCPGSNIAEDCICNQTWTLTDTTSGGQVANGSTSRHFVAVVSPPSLTVTISGDGSGTAICR